MSGPTPAPKSTALMDTRGLLFTVILAGLSGWVDATGFLQWHGLFVSFMSGNTTTLGVLIGATHWIDALTPLSVLSAFVAGVTVGELVGGSNARQAPALVLMLVATLLGTAAIVDLHNPGLGASALLAFGMGVQSAAIHQVGSANLAVTYVTGTLVNIGRGIADVVTGRKDWRHVVPYGMLWLGLLLGAIGGGLVASRSEMVALLASTSLALGLALASWRRTALRV